MPAIVRIGDMCSGHDVFPPRPAILGSPNVFANMLPVVRMTDQWAVHCGVACHGGMSMMGSMNVFVNNLPVTRIGDQISCGSIVVSGSFNVIANIV